MKLPCWEVPKREMARKSCQYAGFVVHCAFLLGCSFFGVALRETTGKSTISAAQDSRWSQTFRKGMRPKGLGGCHVLQVPFRCPCCRFVVSVCFHGWSVYIYIYHVIYLPCCKHFQARVSWLSAGFLSAILPHDAGIHWG